MEIPVQKEIIKIQLLERKRCVTSSFFFRDRDTSGSSTDKEVNKRENWIFVGKGKWVLVNLFYKLG